MTLARRRPCAPVRPCSSNRMVPRNPVGVFGARRTQANVRCSHCSHALRASCEGRALVAIHGSHLACKVTVVEMNRGRDRDDWFEDNELEARRAPDDGGDEGDDWLQDVPSPPGPWLETIDRRVLVLAAFGVVFLIAVLAGAGVFSGSPRTSAPSVTSTPTVTSSTTPPTTAPPPKHVPAPVASLKPGDTGAQVKVLQRALARLGFSTEKIDGQYGPLTEAAVKQFQRSAQLTADGTVGPATLAALATALRHPG